MSVLTRCPAGSVPLCLGRECAHAGTRSSLVRDLGTTAPAADDSKRFQTMASGPEGRLRSPPGSFGLVVLAWSRPQMSAECLRFERLRLGMLRRCAAGRFAPDYPAACRPLRRAPAHRENSTAQWMDPSRSISSPVPRRVSHADLLRRAGLLLSLQGAFPMSGLRGALFPPADNIRNKQSPRSICG